MQKPLVFMVLLGVNVFLPFCKSFSPKTLSTLGGCIGISTNIKSSRHNPVLAGVEMSNDQKVWERSINTAPMICGQPAWSRRSLISSALLFLISEPAFSASGDKLYKGPSAYGFEFRFPNTWIPNKKIGNRHLYDLEVRSSDAENLIEVTIDQITSNSTQQWASLDEAAERLKAQYERQSKGKPVALKTKKSERDSSGLTFYTFEAEIEGGGRYITKLTTTAQVPQFKNQPVFPPI